MNMILCNSVIPGIGPCELPADGHKVHLHGPVTWNEKDIREGMVVLIDTSELVERLKRNSIYHNDNQLGNGQLLMEAANAIETLQIQVDQKHGMDEFEIASVREARKQVGYATNSGMAEAGRLLDAVIIRYDRADSAD